MRDLMQERKERIVGFMREAAYKPLLLKELATVLAVPADDMDIFKALLDELESQGKIYRTNKDRYGVPERMGLITGVLQGSDRGFGFVIPDDDSMEDLFIPAEALNGAMHNDKVIARINRKAAGEKKSEGEVIKIIKRANQFVVGTFDLSRYFGFVTPDDRRLSGDVLIPRDEFNGAKPGDKVVAEIVRWPEQRRNAEGRVNEVLGASTEAGTDILSIIRAHNLKEDFPDAVISEAATIPENVTADMAKGRKDLRNLKMVTIDGEDAKDLDDAVSIEKIPGGIYRLGVHIADVSYYVKEGTPLDAEALERGTSVYLVDRVIPMLPQKLSNGICSLNPGVDRLAFTVMMDIDSSGRVLDHDIFESVIKIDERMTYTNVYKILVNDDPDVKKRYEDFVGDFYTMQELALILRERRMIRGAIDFDFEEAKIILDEKGKPIDVKRYDITIANKIIEEFMLVCNETVAEHFHWANSPFVYRIHENPDPDKVEAFSEFIATLGYNIKGINKLHPRSLQELLKKVKGKREERIVSTLMLRSLAKARYSRDNSGHFGLAAKFYCHFTSPIRRYPDLIIHRIMKEYLKGMTKEREEELLEKLPDIAQHCSNRERAADEAERETEDLKKVEYMKERVGQIFDGVISNVTSFGMFIELDNTIEGLVRMSSMEDDYYVFNDKQYCLVGERSRKVYKIGDPVKVLVARADIALKQIDFTLVADEEPDEMKGNETKSAVRRTEAAKRTGRSKKIINPKVLEKIKSKKRSKRTR